MPPYALDVRLDFQRDWSRILRQSLSTHGFAADPASSLHSLCVHFLNFHRRWLSPYPRTVFTSREFTCPAELQTGLNAVRYKIEMGLDLAPHLSRGIKRIDYNDDLLNDWGIHHLHLGIKIENAFTERTGPVLFVRFVDDKAYFIAVMTHGSWTKQELVHILHRNWPETIRRYRLNGIEDMERPISDDDFKLLRRGHVQSFVQVHKGVIYAPIGGGYATDGTSMLDVMQADRIIENLRRYEEFMRNNIGQYMSACRSVRGQLGPNLTFLLGTDFQQFSAYEVHTGALIPLGPVL